MGSLFSVPPFSFLFLLLLPLPLSSLSLPLSPSPSLLPSFLSLVATEWLNMDEWWNWVEWWSASEMAVRNRGLLQRLPPDFLFFSMLALLCRYLDLLFQ